MHHGTYNARSMLVVELPRLHAGRRRSVELHPRARLPARSRPEVDATKLGVTGRSGGGAYSWWIAALDDRIKVRRAGGRDHRRSRTTSSTAASKGTATACSRSTPTAGTTPQVAALVAPRPLLISNTDKDIDLPARRRRHDVHARCAASTSCTARTTSSACRSPKARTRTRRSCTCTRSSGSTGS